MWTEISRRLTLPLAGESISQPKLLHLPVRCGIPVSIPLSPQMCVLGGLGTPPLTGERPRRLRRPRRRRRRRRLACPPGHSQSTCSGHYAMSRFASAHNELLMLLLARAKTPSAHIDANPHTSICTPRYIHIPAAATK